MATLWETKGVHLAMDAIVIRALSVREGLGPLA